MDRARFAALLLAVLTGALLGEAAWRSAVEARASGAPDDWVEVLPSGPRPMASLAGHMPPRAAAWTLGFQKALFPRDPGLRSGPAPIEAKVNLPEEGVVELWVSLERSSPRPGGVGLIAERVGVPSVRVVHLQRGERRVLPCSEELPAPSDAPLAVRLDPLQGGVDVEVGAVRVHCPVALPAHGPALRGGLRHVQVESIVVGGNPVPPPGPAGRPIWWLGGALLLTLVVGLEGTLAVPSGIGLLSSLPLLLVFPLLGLDLASLAETARLPWKHPTSLAVVVPVGLAGLAKLAAMGFWVLREPADPTGVRDWPRAGVLAALLPASLAATAGGAGATQAVALAVCLCGVVGGALPVLFRTLGSALPNRTGTLVGALATGAALAMGLAGPLHRIAVLHAGGCALALGALLWANANAPRARAYNWTSLAFALCAFAAGEGALRYTVLGRAWSATGSRTRTNDIYGWVPAAEESFFLLEAAEHTDYPDRGFPVRPPPPSGRARVVAFGGSTTGGAFQNDDLREFYPALVEQRLSGGVEVLNQGVGGWTTFHIRRYAADHLAALEPDVVSLYVGHNDLLTPAPAPYETLYAAWQGGGVLRSLSDSLGRFRSYQGLRYLLVALRPGAQRVAVPLDHAHENLKAIITQAESLGAKVVLASEGLAPDPGPLQRYFRMMEALAVASPAVSFVDTASMLHDASEGPLFVDDCHLTRRGHAVVADALSNELRRLRVVDGGHVTP